MEEHHGVSTSTMPAPHGASHMPPPPPPTRPKIRIIHIIAPEIIKTDVANFRDLVQRLTGKPACAPSTPAGMAATATARPPPPVQQEEKETTKKRPRPAPATTTERIDDFAVPQEPSKKRKIKCEVKVEEGGFGDYCSASDLWMDLNPGGFLSFLEEEADVFQGLAAADDFLLPLASSRLDWVGEMYAS